MRFSIVALFVVVGCSSSESSSGTVDTGTTPADVNEPVVPADSCVRPGDMGNEKGVGTYCSPLGRECDGFAGAPSCLADLGQTQWMCTRIGCTMDSQCGSGATCLIEKDGSACVPNRCLDSRDSGTETGSETGADSSTTDASEAG